MEAAPVATGGGGRPLPEEGGKSREVGPRSTPDIRTRFHFMKKAKITGSEAMCTAQFHRRRINTEENTKVLAAVCGTAVLHWEFHQDEFHQDDLKKRMD